MQVKHVMIVVTGVSMTIPEGAVRQDESVDVYLAVLRDDKDRPKLTGVTLFFFARENQHTVIKSYLLTFRLKIHSPKCVCSLTQ